jgi:hypothetical protein
MRARLCVFLQSALAGGNFSKVQKLKRRVLMTSSYITVTADNVSKVSRLLRTEGGFLLTVWGALNWKYSITLYDRPVIKLKPKVAIINEHDGDNATNPLDDREYRFGKKKEKRGLDALFESFDGENYQLGISPEWGGVNWPNFEHGTYIYVPAKEQLAEAFTHIFEVVTAPHDPPLTKTEIEGMLAYIFDDLETKVVVRKIVGAGMLADAACGFG